MYHQVKTMNSAFGNPEGDPTNIDFERLKKQCHNIPGEYKELLFALEVEVPTLIRDALCDIMVFALGAMHLMCADADADMKAVYDSNMSKFCANEEEVTKTWAKYNELNVHTTVQGEFPFKFLRSAKDQTGTNGEFYPANKFLKGINYKEPVFENLNTPHR